MASIGNAAMCCLQCGNPVKAAGPRTEIMTSLPMPIGDMPAAIAADSPPDEPPGVRSRFQGASAAHQGATLDFDDLQSAMSFGAVKTYGRSKLCNTLRVNSLAACAAPVSLRIACIPGSSPHALATKAVS